MLSWSKQSVLYYHLPATPKIDDWARLYVKFNSPRLEIVLNTDHGIWEHIFVNIGPGDWRDFLTKCQDDYLIRKFNPSDVGRADFVRVLADIWPRVKHMLELDLRSERGLSMIGT